MNLLNFDSYDAICILGPTASGKTAYAVNLAWTNDGEIISADSRQVYRRMDIGTGKDLEEYRKEGICIPVHLIDILEPGTKYNVFEYQQDFRRVYSDIVSRGKRAIICGGTGMYIDAVTRGYCLPEVAPDPEFRAEMEKKELSVLVEKLSYYKSLHNTTDTQSKKRVIRALEIARATEQGIRDRGKENFYRDLSSGLPQKVLFLGLDVSREERRRRISQRLDYRLQHGMADEVRRLLEQGIPAQDLIYYGLEYKYVTLYILGELSYTEMRNQLETAIHQFAKRQMTWFRGMERKGVKIEWIRS